MNGQLALTSMIAGYVQALEQSTVQVDDSTLSASGLGMTVRHNTQVVIRSCVIELLIRVRDNAQITIQDCSFQGPKAGIWVSGDANVVISSCVFAPGTKGIEMADFTGALSGTGNSIPDGSLRPARYAWPEGFVQEAQP